MGIAIEEVVGFSLGVDPGADDDGDDEAIDSEHSCHDHRNDRLHHQLRPHHSHRGHPYAALRRAIRRPHACDHELMALRSRSNREDIEIEIEIEEEALTGEDEGCGGAKEAEEGRGLVTAEARHLRIKRDAVGGDRIRSR